MLAVICSTHGQLSRKSGCKSEEDLAELILTLCVNELSDVCDVTLK